MDTSQPDCKAAYEAWAKKEMPWVLETPEDDTERLVRATALIAFTRGYEAAAAKATQ